MENPNVGSTNIWARKLQQILTSWDFHFKQLRPEWEVMTVPDCSMNYQWNQSCSYDYNGVCLPQLEAKNLINKGEEINRNVVLKKKKEFWQICLGEHRLQHSKISENRFARRAKKSGQWPRDVYVAKDQMPLQQAMQVLWMDMGFIYLFHRGWGQVCGNICGFTTFENKRETKKVVQSILISKMDRLLHNSVNQPIGKSPWMNEGKETMWC